MLDDFFEIILDIVLEGAMEAAGSRKVPVPVRMILASSILIFMLGVVMFVLWAGVSRRSIILILSAIAMLLGFASLCFAQVKQFKRKG